MTTLHDLIIVIHILSATLLFGTGLGTAFQMWMTHRSGDVRAIAEVSRNVVRADFFFTLPAVSYSNRVTRRSGSVTVSRYPLELYPKVMLRVSLPVP